MDQQLGILTNCLGLMQNGKPTGSQQPLIQNCSTEPSEITNLKFILTSTQPFFTNRIEYKNLFPNSELVLRSQHSKIALNLWSNYFYNSAQTELYHLFKLTKMRRKYQAT